MLDELGGRAIVKPVMGGSSLGITRAHSVEELQVGLREAGGTGLVEEQLTGAEFRVSVVGDRVLAPVLINPGDGWFGYRAKYQPNASQELCPAPIARSLDQQLRDLALRAARAVGLDEMDYCRVDFMQHSDGSLRCLEVNALPGLTLGQERHGENVGTTRAIVTTWMSGSGSSRRHCRRCCSGRPRVRSSP